MTQLVTQTVSDLKVLYCNFLQPITGSTHAERLDSFYGFQANSYDQFRNRFLHGRKPLLAACAARLTKDIDIDDLIWVDMGAGTGFNVELMQEFMDIRRFKKIYLVDLCHSLCEVARRRVAQKGWNNVEVVEEDVCNFQLPDDVQAHLVTFSYSLTMIPDFYNAIDNANSLLSYEGLIGVSDFYVSNKYDEQSRQHHITTRWLWRSIFELDGIYIGPERRAYLDHILTKEYEYNDAGYIPYIPYLKAPYYVWIGRHKNCTKELFIPKEAFPETKGKGFPSTFIYSMTWEDPREDHKVLDIKENDVIISLTSGGCNILDMLLYKPAKIICVDLNPAQNYLMELKLCGIKHLEFEDFWMMFGDGKHPDFRKIYYSQLSPFLSQGAQKFWNKRLHYFDKCFYHYGAIGWLIATVRNFARLFGFAKDIETLMHADTIEEQNNIWHKRLRSKLMRCTKLIDNRAAMWAFSGVPKRQFDMLQENHTLQSYIARVLDQIAKNTSLNHDNYFYRVCLTGRYTRECCPEYLKEDNFRRLKAENLTDRVEIRTNTYANIVAEGEVSKVILMDHMDWLDETTVREFAKLLRKQLRRDGVMIWRSASRKPWYAEIFEEVGFNVKREACEDAFMDRVNMYASFYVITHKNN